jgi:hypothetical protein
MSLKQTAEQAYAATHELAGRANMAEVVTGGMTILYGPPIEHPDLFIVSFQGGGASPTVYDTWPDRLLYLDDEYKPGNSFKFGRNLCRYAREVGLYTTLETSTVAVPAVFPGEKASSARLWKARSGARSEWRDFSVRWVEKLIDAAKPKVVIVFGSNASWALGLDDAWQRVERNHAQGFMTQGRADYRGVPAVFSGHLSQGYVASEVMRSLASARAIIAGTAP